MNLLVNEKVTHKKFGDGTILEAKEGYLTIKFEEYDVIKKFKYPYSFEDFMAFNKESLQDEAIRLIEKEKAEKRIEEEFKRQEFERIEVESRKEKIEKIKKQRKASKAKADREKAARAKKESSMDSTINTMVEN